MTPDHPEPFRNQDEATMNHTHATLVPEMLEAIESRREPKPRRVGASARVLLACSLLALGAGTAAAAAFWHPTIGSPKHGHLTTAQSPAPIDQSGSLQILRRSQTDRDRQPRVQAILKRLYPDYQSGVRVNDIRFLADFQNGDFAVLIPSETAGFDDAKHGETIKHDVLCFVLGLSSNGADPEQLDAASKCGDTADLNLGHIELGAPSGGVLTGLVPDAVATVSAQLPGGATTRVPVTDNVYRLVAPRGGAFTGATGVTWYDDNGLKIEH